MTTPTPRERAHTLIVEAIKTGVRGELRDALLHAERPASFAGVAAAQSPTDLEYRNLPVGQKLMDKARSGLMMRSGKRAGKVWVFRYADPATAKQREFQFGRYPYMTVAAARARWEDLRAIRNDGKDPAIVVQAVADAKLTMGGLIDMFVSDYAMKVKRSWKTDKRLLEKHVTGAYRAKPAEDITHADVSDILLTLHRTGAGREAEKLRSALLTMFNVASGRTRKIAMLGDTWLPRDHVNPVANVMLPDRTAANHKPTQAELKRYLTGLDEMKATYGGALRLQAWTMTRIGEVVGLSWDELDLEAGVWTLPAARAKNGRAHFVMLPNQAVDLLRSRQETAQGDYVFPAVRGRRDRPEPAQTQRALASARADMNLPDAFTSHSLRHAALTWCAEQGCPRDVRDRLTNHVSGGGVDAIYNAAALNGPARDWWQRWTDYLDALA